MQKHNRKFADRYTHVQLDIARKIEKFGFTLISVFDPESGTHFVYTVGLEREFEHPELIVLDLPVELAAEFLNGLVELIAEGRHFRAGQSPRDLPVHPPIRFYPVARRHYREYLNVGR